MGAPAHGLIFSLSPVGGRLRTQPLRREWARCRAVLRPDRMPTVGQGGSLPPVARRYQKSSATSRWTKAWAPCLREFSRPPRRPATQCGYSFFRLWAVQSSAHCVRTLSSPRTVQRRNPMTRLIVANTGSMRPLRCRSNALYLGSWRLRRCRSKAPYCGPNLRVFRGS